MENLNLYDTLRVSPKASNAEIKQSYRRLVKLFHPDSNSQTADPEEIVRINAAYEVLGDPQRRKFYDRKRGAARSQIQTQGQRRNPGPQNNPRSYRSTAPNLDAQLQQWLKQVYHPVDRILGQILYSLEDEIDRLSADPFDDELMGDFQDYLETSRDFLEQAQGSFQSKRNPANVASAAAHLYYCLDRVKDGIEELEFFTLNYDEHYLHTGQELFRIAARLRQEAQEAIQHMFK